MERDSIIDKLASMRMLCPRGCSMRRPARLGVLATLLRGLLLIIVGLSTQGCQKVASSTPQVTLRMTANKFSVSIFDLYFEPADDAVAQDIGKVLVDSLDVFRTNFRQSFQHRIAVEIYPDQTAYDAHALKGTRRGSPACSGNLTIQMVSPRSPIRIAGLSYKTRLLMARHELAHLFVTDTTCPAITPRLLASNSLLA